MDDKIVEEIKNFVENECKKTTSHYGYEPFVFHFIPMVNYAQQLAIKFNADMEIILISAWLHDIGSIVNGREDHHINGAKIAEEKLKELSYPLDKIELVKKCILNHRGSTNFKRESIEEQIIAEADILSNFENISGIFKAAFVYENLNQKEASKAVFEKLTRKFNQLQFEESKKLVQEKYKAVEILFKE